MESHVDKEMEIDFVDKKPRLKKKVVGVDVVTDRINGVVFEK